MGIQYHFICGMYMGLCITPEIDLFYASTLHSMEDKENVLETIMSPITQQVASLKLNHNNYNNNNDNDSNEIKTDEIDEEEEDQRSQTIAKLLSHRQQQLLQDEDIVGTKKAGFEDAASLQLDLQSVSETTQIKFKQLSIGDSADDDSHDIDD